MLKKMFKSKYRRLYLVLIDLLSFFAITALIDVFSEGIINNIPLSIRHVISLDIFIMLCVFAIRASTKAYHYIWRYTSTRAYMCLIVSDVIAAMIASLFVHMLYHTPLNGVCMEVAYTVMLISLNLISSVSMRMAYRLIYKQFRLKNKTVAEKDTKIRIGIIGAGQIGAYLANELSVSPNSQYSPQCFIDIDRIKVGRSLAGLPIYSNKDITSVIQKFKISEFVVAIGDTDAQKTERLWKKYTELGCKVKIYDSPVYSEVENGQKKKRVIRDFSIEDLLFRQPILVNEKENSQYYKNKTVLVTGGGGSIGSELCRQIARCEPRKLVIFDIYENNAYDIQQELRYKYGTSLDFEVEIGSVRDVERLEAVFMAYKPDIVFHAAAHKHVPLMEHNPSEAIKNNVIGTYNTANMAEKYGTEKFILISTDKAVNPTNIMGATKRICEMIVQCRTDSKTSFAAVRFGNVLGSNGSVIPLFKRQIAAGGPITITDKRIIRYFMTIPEASQLVMLAGTKAKKGELFILDMGQPVRIYDLAVNMIKLMGYVPGKDIEIREIGLRPGEKLFEELLIKGESVTKTDNDLIFIEKDMPHTRQEVEDKLSVLYKVLDEREEASSPENIKSIVKEIVPTFVEPEEVNNAVSLAQV